MSMCHPRATNGIINNRRMLNPQLQCQLRQSLSSVPQQINKVGLSFDILYIYILTHSTLLVHRLKPATSSPDDGAEEDDIINVDVSSQSNRHRTTSNNGPQDSSASLEDDENADDEDDLSEGCNDLSGLNSASLQKKLSSEVKSLLFLFICI